MAVNVYSASFFPTIAAASIVTETFRINNNNRQLKIKSILLSIEFYFGFTRVDYERSTNHYVHLLVGSASSKIGRAMTPIIAPSMTETGDTFLITKPGQYLFDSFFINNFLDFAIEIKNWSVNLNTADISVIVETEEKIIYI